MKSYTAKIQKEGVGGFELEVASVALINSGTCVNCGECRDICPVDAIVEKQRVICRLCPGCTDRPALIYDDMEALATKESCTNACPLGISPQGYINLTAAGKEQDAFRHIWQHNPLPSICGRICHHPCEQACKRGTLVDEPMAIRGIKRYLTGMFADQPPEKYPVIYQEEVAVVGAGPAGLTAAHKLALMGYRVTVFDKEPIAGGMLNVGIPKFRLPRDVTANDISKLEQAGIRFVFGKSISKAQMDELKRNFDKVIVAAGAPYSKELKIEGWRKEGVLTALHFMERVNQDQAVRRHPSQAFKPKGDVVVIGGGNVAIDCARTAIRLGAKSVTAVCVESGTNVPCHVWDREEAEQEGVTILEGWAPGQFLGDFNALSGVEFNKVTSFEKNPEGGVKLSTDSGQSKAVPADLVIVAIGQSAAGLWKEYEKDECVVFAGDVISDKCSVVDAMASGLNAAIAVDEALQGRKMRHPATEHTLEVAPIEEKIYPAARSRTVRPPMPIAPPAERAGNFKEVEGDYSKDVIDVELIRCLQCGYSEVNSDRCIGCGACRTICPKGDVITMAKIEKEGKVNA